MTLITGTEKQIKEGARDYWTIEAMAKYGGSFVKALAEAARHADRQNLAKIKSTWVEYWAEYEKNWPRARGKARARRKIKGRSKTNSSNS